MVHNTHSSNFNSTSTSTKIRSTEVTIPSTANILMARVPAMAGQMAMVPRVRLGGESAELAINATSFEPNVMARHHVLTAWASFPIFHQKFVKGRSSNILQNLA